MEQKISEDIVFKNIKATDIEGADKVFEGCRFLNCDLSYADLGQMTFINCVMTDCNLSLIKLVNTGLQDVEFNGCKITGVNFSECSNFSLSVSFDKCVLDYSVWNKKKLKDTKFTNCNMEEAAFNECDLTSADFGKCNLNRTTFNRCILKAADFGTAYNFNIDPENNTMAKAKFSADTLAGLLVKYNLIIE